MSYKILLFMMFTFATHSVQGQDIEKYELHIELWNEIKGYSIEFEKLNGEILITRYDSVVHTEYTLENICNISIKTDYPRAPNTDARLQISIKDFDIETDCQQNYKDLIVMFNQIFSLNFNDLPKNNFLTTKVDSNEESKLFKLGNYNEKTFSKGFEIIGNMILDNQNIESAKAKFRSHFPTSAFDGYSGGIIELKKTNK